MISAGFAEIGRDGAERQERLLALVRAHGARLLGPNCLGIAAALINHDPTSIHPRRAARHADEDNEPEELPPFGSRVIPPPPDGEEASLVDTGASWARA